MPGRPLLIQQRLKQVALASAAVATAALTLAACGSTGTQVDAPTPQGAAATACAALVGQLPSSVADQQSRPVLPPSPNAAAWGDPAIVLRCGVDEPDALIPTSQLFTIDGIDWFPEPGTDATTFTTIGRVANVEVVVPRSVSPEAAALTDLAAAIKSANQATPSASP